MRTAARMVLIFAFVFGSPFIYWISVEWGEGAPYLSLRILHGFTFGELRLVHGYFRWLESAEAFGTVTDFNLQI